MNDWNEYEQVLELLKDYFDVSKLEKRTYKIHENFKHRKTELYAIFQKNLDDCVEEMLTECVTINENGVKTIQETVVFEYCDYIITKFSEPTTALFFLENYNYDLDDEVDWAMSRVTNKPDTYTHDIIYEVIAEFVFSYFESCLWNNDCQLN